MQIINLFLRKIQIFTQHLASKEAIGPRRQFFLTSEGLLGPSVTPGVLQDRLLKPLSWVQGVSFLSCGELLKLE